MGWSVYILDQRRKTAHDLGSGWASGFPEEALLDVVLAEKEMSARGRADARALAARVYAIAERAGFDVRVHEGHEIPDGFTWVDD